MSEIVDYDTVAALGAQLDRPIDNPAGAGSHQRPFNAGRPGRRERAEWFGALWERFGFGPGTHLRRVHYSLYLIAIHVEPAGRRTLRKHR